MEELFIPDEEWDILIILDACRYDAFQTIHKRMDFEGELVPRDSKCKNTVEWRDFNFSDKDKCSDITVVSGNPQVSRYKFKKDMGEVPFEDIIEVWRTDWDERLNCVLPESVTEKAIQVYKNKPYKRLLIHYLQPHFPYIKSTTSSVGRGQIWGYREAIDEREYEMDELDIKKGTIFTAVSQGLVPVERVRKGYMRTLHIVMEEVKGLLSHFDEGVDVKITADHGELLGYDRDGRQLGHGPNLPDNPNLTTVPWFNVDKSMLGGEND